MTWRGVVHGLRRGALGTLLVGVITVLVLCVIEGAASFALSAYSFFVKPEPFMAAERVHTEYDELLGWRHIANADLKDLYGPGADLRTNSQRLRADYDYTPAVPAGKIRIVCSGDSFTLGYGVGNDDAWCARLQQMDSTIEGVNMGQAAYGVDQAFLWYRRDATWLQHDIQLFAFITSDFERMQDDNYGGYPKPVVRAVDGKLVVGNVPVPRTMANIPRRYRLRDAIGQLRVVAFAQAALHKLGIGSGDERLPLLSQEQVRASASLVFEELKKLNEAKGSQLVLLYLPRSGDETFQWSDPWRAFVGHEAERLGVPFIDLVPEVRQMPLDQVETLFLNGFSPGHYNVKGNEWVARLVYHKLAELHLVHGAGP